MCWVDELSGEVVEDVVGVRGIVVGVVVVRDCCRRRGGGGCSDGDDGGGRHCGGIIRNKLRFCCSWRKRNCGRKCDP